jgi:colanic acid biosynthesis glycosyl transferase WcaI
MGRRTLEEVDLLIVSPTFHPEPIGTPVYATDAMRWFSDQGLRVAVVTAMPFYPGFVRYADYGRERRRDQVEGVAVHRVPTIVPRGGAASLRLLSDLNYAAQGRRLARRLRARAVLTFSPGVPLAASIKSVVQGQSTHVVVVHDIQSGLAGPAARAPRWAVTLLSRLERRLLDRGDRLVALSEGMARDLRALGTRAPIEVIPIWATTPIPEQPPPPTLRSGPLTVMYSGNLGRKQGVEVLIDLAERIQRAATDVRVVVQGEGQRRAALEKRARALGLTSIEFRDLVPQSALADSLASADIHVVPQHPDVADSVLPSKLFNIMAVGRPIVVAAKPGTAVAAMSETRSGLTRVTPGDADQLVAAVNRLVESSELRAQQGVDAHAYVAQHHGRDPTMQHLRQLLLGG